jgi:galactokinase
LSSYPTLSDNDNVVRAFGPGRVNLIGEHTDYNAGLALPFALTLGVTVTARPLAEPRVRVDALDLKDHDQFSLARPGRIRGWRAFVRGAVVELQEAGIPLRGTHLEITGDLPRGSGMSSSAALEVALCLALIGAAGAQPPERMQLAKLCQKVENEWVGAQTGLLDQIASLFGEAEHAILIDFESLEVELMPLELGDHHLVTLDSGQPHRNAASGYNRRRAECIEAAHRMGKESLREAMIQDLHMLPDELARRARHVISENGRVEQAVTALRTGDLPKLGRLLDASHASLRDDYEVSTDAVEAAVVRLKEAGALGARLLGGGFGGNVLGLMPPTAAAPDGARVVVPGAGAHLV